MSVKALKEAVKRAARDKFEVGDVVRWTSAGRYTYAAIKTEIGWFTTSRYGNPFVAQVLDFDELLEVIARSETTDVAYASVWTEVEG